MFDAFTKVVAQADARGQFINTSEIDALAAGFDSNKRLDAVNRISSNASTSLLLPRQLFAQQPSSPPAVTLTPPVAWLPACATWRSSCAMSPIPPSPVMLPSWKIVLNGLRETYLALGTPGAGCRREPDEGSRLGNC